MRTHPYRLLNIIALLAVIVVNALANLLPIAGKTTGELSDQYPVLITPAGYVFSIWSLIYLLLAGFVIYQAMPSHADRQRIRRIGPLFILTCVFNCSWILVWHYELLPLSVLIMLALLGTLIVIYTGIRQVQEPPTLGERLFVYLPFSLYLGWISVATIVNVTVLLYDLGWDGFGWSATTWTLIGIGVTIVLAAAIGYRYSDAAFMLVFVWALIGIGVKQQAGDSTVSMAAFVAAGLIFLLMLGMLLRRRRAL